MGFGNPYGRYIFYLWVVGSCMESQAMMTPNDAEAIIVFLPAFERARLRIVLRDTARQLPRSTGKMVGAVGIEPTTSPV